ncbi:MAG: hypothetical protein Kow0069_36350 [Promethearchaeota archaeon]
MKTFLVVWHSANGDDPLSVAQRLTGLGFKPVKGYHDYAYDWGGDVTVDEVLSFSIKVHETLRGTGVLYKLETLDSR